MTSPRVPLLRKQWLSIIDASSTMVCLDAAGMVRDLDETFQTLAGDFLHPPAHRWCRSVCLPWLPGMVDEQRAEANEEIGRRPMRERRKGPGGVGARIPPPPHQATHDRRAGFPVRDDTYVGTYDRLVPGEDQGNKSVISRYLEVVELDRHLRTGDLTDEELALVAEVDAVVQAGRLGEEVTVFTALRHPVVSGLRVSDVVSDDSYMQVALDPAVAARWGHPVALTLPAGLPVAGLDRSTQRLLLARRHSWLLLALGAVLVAVLL